MSQNALLYKILCVQSPAFFLLAIILLIRYFTSRRSHPVKATVRLVFCILSIAVGVALYFLGIYREVFTIRDFYKPTAWSLLGLGAVILAYALALFNGMKNRTAQRKLDQAAREARVEKEAAVREAVRTAQSASAAAAESAAAEARLDLARENAQAEAKAAMGEEQPISLTLEPEDK